MDFLQVLAGEEADITSSMLSTDDADTSADELVYHVESPTNGMVALKEAPEESILNFTQAQINNGEVIFIHEGEGNISPGPGLFVQRSPPHHVNNNTAARVSESLSSDIYTFVM